MRCFIMDINEYQIFVDSGMKNGALAEFIADCKKRAKEAIEKDDIKAFNVALKEKYSISGQVYSYGATSQERCDENPTIYESNYKKGFCLNRQCRVNLLSCAIENYRTDMVKQLLLSMEDPDVCPPVWGTRQNNHLSARELECCFKKTACLNDGDAFLNYPSHLFPAIGALNSAGRAPNTGIATTMSAFLAEPSAYFITTLLLQHSIKHNVYMRELDKRLPPYPFSYPSPESRLSPVLSDEQKAFVIQVFALQDYLLQLKGDLIKHECESSSKKYQVIINPLLKNIATVYSTLLTLVEFSGSADKIIKDIATILYQAQFDNTALSANTVRAKFRAVCAFFSTASENKISDHGGSLGVLLNAQLTKLKETLPKYFEAPQKEVVKRDLKC